MANKAIKSRSLECSISLRWNIVNVVCKADNVKQSWSYPGTLLQKRFPAGGNLSRQMNQSACFFFSFFPIIYASSGCTVLLELLFAFILFIFLSV